jgi:hypothetical protein
VELANKPDIMLINQLASPEVKIGKNVIGLDKF